MSLYRTHNHGALPSGGNTDKSQLTMIERKMKNGTHVKLEPGIKYTRGYSLIFACCYSFNLIKPWLFCQ